MAKGSPTFVSKYYPPASLNFLPYIFTSREEAFQIFDGPVGKGLNTRIAEKTGLVGLDYEDFGGFVQLFNKKRPVATLEDYKGLKLALPPSDVERAFFQLLGAIPVSVDVNEEYTAVQQGLIDGSVHGFTTTNSLKLYEVGPFISQTDNFISTAITWINGDFLKSLPADLQTIVRQAALAQQTYARSAGAQAIEDAKQNMISKGAKYNTVSPAEMKRMRDAVAPVVAKAKADWGTEAAGWIDTCLKAAQA
jgi:TRAP-type C4-dicarboxylate transport system substrate-binding protein